MMQIIVIEAVHGVLVKNWKLRYKQACSAIKPLYISTLSFIGIFQAK